MLSYEVPMETYKTLPLQERLMIDIGSHKIQEKFHVRISHILTDRWGEQHKITERMDENTALWIKEHNDEFRKHLEIIFALERVYESEYGEMDKETEKFLDDLAIKKSEELLKEYGWIKGE